MGTKEWPAPGGANAGDQPELADRFRGAMLGVAIGDALGAPFEGSPPPEPSVFSGWESRVPHPLRYTDDTLMTLGVARALVECRGQFDGSRMAAIFAEDHAAEPWRGYGAGPPRVFELIRHGAPWDQAGAALFGGAGSFGNGAAMRSAPMGLLHFRHMNQADAVARAAARITHTHALGMDGAAVIACAVGLLVQTSDARALDAAALLSGIRGHPKTRELRGALDSVARLDPGAPARDVIRVLGNGIEAHRSVPTAVYALLRHRDSFAAAVVYAVSLGGDADTIASMTGALSGALYGASGIPPPWRDAVEGRDELIELAERLLALAP